MGLSMQESRFDGMTDNALLIMLNTGDPTEQIQARGEVRKRLIDRKFALGRIMSFVEDGLSEPSRDAFIVDAYLNAIKKIVNAAGVV